MSVSQVKLLEGKTIAAKIREEIAAQVEQYVADGLERPGLMAIQVAEDASADWYVGQQEKISAKLGIRFDKTPAGRISNQAELLKKIKEANESGFHGVFIAMPLPKGFDPDEALLALDPRKDVEGIHPTSLGLIVLRRAKLIPPTAYAAYSLILSTGIPLRGKRAVLVGQSAIVGRPLNLLLGEQRVTTTICNTGTSAEDLKTAVAASDIVIACAGTPNMVKGEWIKEGAVVIDVGTTEVEGKLVGDVEFETAKDRAGFITPVPGGVGPLTVTMLMQNLMHAYRWQKGL